MSVRIIIGDALGEMKKLQEGSVDLVCTSPPFWKQRDYDHPRQLGTEKTPTLYANKIVRHMREARRILKPTGALILELGDTYAAGGNGGGGSRAAKRRKLTSIQQRTGWRSPPAGYKEKDLSLSPFLVADKLRRDGWYLRKVIIWSKGTATEPPRLDRPSVSHSYIFLLSKREHSHVRNPGEDWFYQSVWSVRPNGHGTDHPAPMEPEIARRCIAMACPPGGTVLDPYAGAGTTGLVADRLKRNAVLIELNPAYAADARRRIDDDRGGLLDGMEAA